MDFSFYKGLIEQYLAGAVRASVCPDEGLNDAVRYSLLAGGKRIRPALVLEFCRISGGNINATLPVACSIEMIHTYSLIHDDLPCMDNDDLRRGKPTNHKVFGECPAVLAGDALQPLAFSEIMRSSLADAAKVKCAEILSEAAGINGMCRGQYMDMLGEGKRLSAEELTDINNLKTGALLSAACKLGVAAAGGTEAQLAAAGAFGEKLGLAFQIRDDVLDVLSTDAELGKSVGSDAQEHKNTYMALYGPERCALEIERLTGEAVSALKAEFADTAFLEDLAEGMKTRNH